MSRLYFKKQHLDIQSTKETGEKIVCLKRLVGGGWTDVCGQQNSPGIGSLGRGGARRKGRATSECCLGPW